MRVPLFFQMIKKIQNPKFWLPLWRHVQEISAPLLNSSKLYVQEVLPLSQHIQILLPPH